MNIKAELEVLVPIRFTGYFDAELYTFKINEQKDLIEPLVIKIGKYNVDSDKDIEGCIYDTLYNLFSIAIVKELKYDS